MGEWVEEDRGFVARGGNGVLFRSGEWLVKDSEGVMEKGWLVGGGRALKDPIVMEVDVPGLAEICNHLWYAYLRDFGEDDVC